MGKEGERCQVFKYVHNNLYVGFVCLWLLGIMFSLSIGMSFCGSLVRLPEGGMCTGQLPSYGGALRTMYVFSACVHISSHSQYICRMHVLGLEILLESMVFVLCHLGLCLSVC